MRRLLVLGILLAGAGCQSLKECHDGCEDDGCRKRPHNIFKHFCSECEVKKPCEKPVAAKPPVAAPKTEVAAPVQAPAIAQDILLVPKMVYIPYAPQTPVAPVRVASPPPLAAPPEEQPKVAAPAPAPKTQAAPPCDVTTQMLDVCKKLNHRLDCLEQKIQDRNICPTPLQHCPTPLFPNFRRPLFYRGDPLEPCEQCPTVSPSAAPSANTMEQIAPPIVIPSVDPK